MDLAARLQDERTGDLTGVPPAEETLGPLADPPGDLDAGEYVAALPHEPGHQSAILTVELSLTRTD